jgi:hypothetical protein
VGTVAGDVEFSGSVNLRVKNVKVLNVWLWLEPWSVRLLFPDVAYDALAFRISIVVVVLGHAIIQDSLAKTTFSHGTYLSGGLWTWFARAPDNDYCRSVVCNVWSLGNTFLRPSSIILEWTIQRYLKQSLR